MSDTTEPESFESVTEALDYEDYPEPDDEPEPFFDDDDGDTDFGTANSVPWR
jgi:hypothetical protein